MRAYALTAGVALLCLALGVAVPRAMALPGVTENGGEGPGPVGLEVSADRATVAVNESFTLTVRVVGETGERPDFSALTDDFDILRRSQRSRVRSAEDGYARETLWELTMMPRHEAIAAVPAIPVGTRHTAPLPLRVTPATDDHERGAAFVEAKVSTREPWIHAEVIYTVRLYLSAGARGTRLSEPRARDGAVIARTLGEDRQYQTRRGGQTYLVWERRYALIPQRSGEVVLEPVTLEAQVLDDRRSPRIARFRSEPMVLDVRPMAPRPPELPPGGWLPSLEVAVDDGWSTPPDRLVAGEPVTRTILTRARGVSAAQLPTPQLRPPDGVRVYADQPTLEDSADREGSLARRIDRFALVPARAGTLTMPEVVIPWWHAELGRWETSTLEPVNLEVDPAPVADAPAMTAPLLDEPGAGLADAGVSRLELGLWRLLAAVLAVAWLLTLLLWWWRRRGDDAAVDGAPSRPAAGPGPTARAALARLRAACRADDPDAAQQALLAWARVHWREKPPRSAGAVAERLPAGLRAPVVALSRARYGDGTWDPVALTGIVDELSRLHDDRGTVSASAARLAPLHPESGNRPRA